jgi:hypothetical protein
MILLVDCSRFYLMELDVFLYALMINLNNSLCNGLSRMLSAVVLSNSLIRASRGQQYRNYEDGSRIVNIRQSRGLCANGISSLVC